MEDYLKKGRSLQLEGLAHAPIKVTIGFKCEGKEKINLAQEAHQSAMTLSEYVEYLVSQRHQLIQTTTGPTRQEWEQATARIKRLRRKLAVYEQHEVLKTLLAANLDKSIPWRDSTGQEHTVVVRTVADIFNVLVSSFKTN
jgi:hypothetical protein